MRARTSFMVTFNVIRYGSERSMPTATSSASLRGEDPLRIVGMGAGATPCVIDQIILL